MTQNRLQFKVPLILKLLFPMTVGVIVTFYFPSSIPFSVLTSFLVILFFLSIPVVSKQYFQRSVFGVIASLFFFLLGFYLSDIYSNNGHQNYFMHRATEQEDVFQVEIIEVPEIKANSVKCFVNVCAVNEYKSVGKALLYFEDTERALNLKYGDVLCLKANFKAVRTNGNPMEFDYSRYLKIHNVTHQSYVRNNDWVMVGGSSNTFFSWIYHIRNSLGSVLDESGLQGSNLMVARALILGEKSSLDRETLRTFSSAGAMHVLAVSGLHVGIVMLIFSFLLRPVKLLPNGRVFFVVIVVLCIWFYALVTGLSSSVLRAAVMFSFVVIGKEMERESSVYQSIMVSAFILILFKPFVIFEVGFQLSYLAVLGIVFLQPRIYNLLYVKNSLLDKVWQISSVSIAAQLATFPLGLYYFHQFPNFFMISNLIVIPLAFAILLAGMLYFTLFWIPGISKICLLLLEFLLTVLNEGVKWVEGLPHSIYWGVSIHWFEVFWMYAIILLGAIAFINRKTKLLFVSMSLTILLLVFNVAEKQYIASTNRFIVYNVNNSTAIDLFYGGRNIFIADQSLIDDEDKLLFHVKHNWFYRSGQEDPYLTVPIDSNLRLIDVADRTFFRMDSTIKYACPMTDIVLLENISFLDNRIIEGFKKSETLIIVGHDVGYRLMGYLELKINPNNLHVLKNDGAFELAF